MLLQIAVLGDFRAESRNHQATNDALHDAAYQVGCDVAVNWTSSEMLAAGPLPELLANHDAIFAAPGCPFRSMEGVLAGIRFARRNGVPFLGTCGGFQYALIEYARDVLGLAGADSEENGGTPKHAVIRAVACPVTDRPAGAPKLSGVRRFSVKPGTRMAEIYGCAEAQEEYFCNFEVNPDYVSSLEANGVTFCAYGEGGEVRAMELGWHPFFMATLFQPQLGVRLHPVIVALLRAAVGYRDRAMAAPVCALTTRFAGN